MLKTSLPTMIEALAPGHSGCRKLVGSFAIALHLNVWTVFLKKNAIATLLTNSMGAMLQLNPALPSLVSYKKKCVNKAKYAILFVHGVFSAHCGKVGGLINLFN